MNMFISVIGCSVVFSVLSVNAESKPSETVLESADAKISPNGILLFRLKRSPQLNRAMTFSGFMPNGAFSAFSAAADSFPNPMTQWYSKPSEPTDNLSPPEADQGVPLKEDPAWVKKPKKKPYNPSKYFPSDTTQYEDEEEYDPPTRSKGKGSSATASFNAWFPIVLGSFPNQYGRNGQEEYRPQQQDNKPSQENRPYQEPYYRQSDYPGQTVIANSVSNGRGGVASSHAVAYGKSYTPEGRNYYSPKETTKSPQSYY